MKQQREYNLQKAIAQYLRTAHKKVMFLSDARAALRLTIPQQVRAKAIQADGFHCPDMVLFEPRGGYCSAFLELKAESPFKQDGTLKKSEHLERQWATIERLRKAGFYAEMVWDFDQAREMIDGYLKQSSPSETQ
jgi:hypothetical protein